jgi:glycosyltransferase involved in cell wall biosynthesis
MRILMLDKNWLIDRRIALMIETLAKEGHEFRIVCAKAPPGRWERPEAAVETIAFSLEDSGHTPAADGVFPMPAHVNEVLHPWGTDARTKSDLPPRGASTAERIAGYLRNPSAALRVLSASGLPPHVKWPAIGFFGVLDAPRRMTAIPPPKDDFVHQRVLSPARVPLDFWDKMAVRYAEVEWKPEIVCANDFPTLRAAIEMKRRLGCSVVYDAHELYSYQPAVPHIAAKRIFREERILLKHIDGLILVNEQHKQIVDRDSPYAGPIALCSNATTAPAGFDVTRRYNLIRQKAPIPEQHQIMLFHGGINKERRVDFLLRGLAIARSRKVHQVFLTFGAEIEEFRKYSEDLGIGARVHFLPLVPWRDVLFWAASADCGVMPYQATDQNTAISSPNKMYEFILAGTPMIGSSDLVNVQRIVAGEGFGVTLPLRSVTDYADAIDLMFDESKGGPARFREALIKKGRAYHWDEQIGGVIDLYRKIAYARAKR